MYLPLVSVKNTLFTECCCCFSLSIKLWGKSCVIFAGKCHLMIQTERELFRKGNTATPEARKTGIQIYLFETTFKVCATSFFIIFYFPLQLIRVEDMPGDLDDGMPSIRNPLLYFLSHFLWWLIISLIMMSDYASDDNDLKVFVSFFHFATIYIFWGQICSGSP